jgi:hypothetical protein
MRRHSLLMEKNYRRIEDLSEEIKYSFYSDSFRCSSIRIIGAARLLKTLSSKAEPTNAPEAYPLGYVEDAFKVRTKLGGVFSSRQNKK